MAGLLLWVVIITVLEAARILSSSVEYLSVRLYNSSIVTGGSRDSKWKNGVVGPKLLRKFWRTASILYESICWTTPPNLLEKLWMDSFFCLKMVCKELIFPFSQIEHRYWDKNATHNLLNELIDLRGSLWNQAWAIPFKLAGNTLHSKRSSPALSMIA